MKTEKNPRERTGRKTITTLVLTASAALALAPAVFGGQPGRRASRVWTNDDFAAATVAGQAAARQPGAGRSGLPTDAEASGKTAAAAPAAPARELSEEGQELNQVRKEVRLEMLASARARHKAYEETVTSVEKKLAAESNEFRAAVYKKILSDTLELKEINKKVLEQFEEKPSAPETTTPAEEKSDATGQTNN